jgi:hypothetical protein
VWPCGRYGTVLYEHFAASTSPMFEAKSLLLEATAPNQMDSRVIVHIIDE